MKKLVYLLIALGAAATACMDEVATPEPPEMVIEAYISQGRQAEVYVTTTVNPNQEGSLQEMIVRWGAVSLSDGTDTVLLTGGPLKGTFPPYHYYSYKIRGEVGKTYTLTAEWDGATATATATLLPPTPIDSVVVRPVEGNDTLCSATLWFTAPADAPAYYYLSILEDKEGARPLPAYLGTVAATEPGTAVALPVMRPKYKFGEEDDYEAQLRRGERYELMLCRVEEQVYDFWTDYCNMVAFTSTGVFINAQANLQGNVEGGKGVFSAQGVARHSLDLRAP